MRPVTMYRSRDGRVFETEADCLRHEEILNAADEIHTIIGPRPKDPHCVFANGGGFIQRVGDSVGAARERLSVLALQYHGSSRPRVIDDCDSPLSDVSFRLRCIDSQGREWGQPYYAINPHSGTQEEWADET